MWLGRQPLPDDERSAIDRHVRELDRLADDLDILDREIAQGALDDRAIKQLMTITGVNLTVVAGVMAAIPWEARQLLWPEPTGTSVGTRRRSSWTYQQDRS